MTIKEVLETNFYDELNLSNDKSAKMERWVKLLKDGDPLLITYEVNKIPRIEVESMIQKLLKPGYKKLKGTSVAISKLKWRRGH